MCTSADGFPWTDAIKIAAGKRYMADMLAREGQHDWHVQRWRIYRRDKMQAEWLAERKRIEMAPDFIGARCAT